MRAIEKISQFFSATFAIWVVLFAILGFLSPANFTWIMDYITPLLGIIMFGMGLTLSPQDFKEIARRPKDVAIGVLAQFIVMPLLAFILAISFPVSPAVAAGVILVGCCPGGTASNVMTYLAKGDTALSVTITSVSTLLAPFLTPALIYLLASEWVSVSIGSLFWSICKIVLIPIILGVIVQSLFKKQVEKSVKVLPLVSVIAIVAIVAGVVGANKVQIAETGLTIMAIVMLHNVLGLLIGYWVAKWLKMGLFKQKAVSIEVGMQNSGLGAALAAAHFSPLAAVPSAIFSVWHNISGPIIATYFSKKKNEPEHEQNDHDKDSFIAQ